MQQYNPKEAAKKNNPELNMDPEDFPEIFIKNQYDKYVFSDVAGPGPYYDYYYTLAKNINNAKIYWKPLFKKEDKMKAFEIEGDDIIFLTAKGASNYKICKTSLINPNVDHPEVLVDEDSTATITDFVKTKKGLFFVKTKNGVDAKLYCLEAGKFREVPIPNSAGYIDVISKSPEYNDLWIETRGWTNKKKRYKYSWIKNKFITQELNKTTTYSNFENVIIKEIEIPSHDGTLVPLSLIYNKDLKLNGTNRVLLHGYGVYGLSRKPKMSDIDAFSSLLAEGGVFGKKKLNTPKTTEAMATIINVLDNIPAAIFASESHLKTKLMAKPAIIQPIVPQTLTIGNCFAGSFI